MSLRVRIASILAAVALGVGAFAATAAYVSTRSELHDSVDDVLFTQASAAVDGRGPRGGGGPGRGPSGPTANGCPSPDEMRGAAAVQVGTEGGEPTVCLDGGVELTVVDLTTDLTLRTYRLDGERYRVITVMRENGTYLQIARSLHEVDAVLSGLGFRLAGIALLASVAAAALGWFIAARIVAPIVRLRNATHDIATTLDLSTPIDATGPGEVGSLATSFVTMVGALARSQDQQRRLVSDASHEMRTPLTSLRSNVELLRKVEKLPVDERQEVVDDVLEDIDELSTLLGELVDLASDLSAAEAPESLLLSDLARAVATRTQRRAGRDVSVLETSDLEITGRPRQLERVIANLVDNAVKYSDDGPIEIEVDGRTVTVRDRGRGIPAADVDRIFDRFYRALDARTESGSGLGLAIVDEIIRSHGGTTFARNRPVTDGGGAEVGFTLP